MHAPVFAPHGRIDRPIVLFEQTVEVLAEGGLQMRQVEQELRLFDTHKSVLLVEPGAGNQAMDVRMELQFLGPGVQQGDETNHLGAQAFVGCQFFAQSAGGGLEEQFIGLLFTRAHETTAQFGRQGEGDQEVGSID